jgi:hypothetical protein
MGIFGIKIYHLATLVHSLTAQQELSRFSVRNQVPRLQRVQRRRQVRPGRRKAMLDGLRKVGGDPRKLANPEKI